MTDDIFISDLTLEPDDDGTPPPGPGLWVGQPTDDLETVERLYRECPIAGAFMVLFTEENEQGDEVWESGDNGRQQRRWQAFMGWPRLPTLAEAWQWQRYVDGSAAAWAYERGGTAVS